MVLKVAAYDSKEIPTPSTDVVRFLYPEEKRIQLSLLGTPQVLIFPTAQGTGLLKINRSQKVSITKDGYFTYGAWPQKRLSPIQTKKLNEMLQQNQIRKAGHYYDLANRAAHEYELGKKRYVLIPDTGAWFEVCPIEWIYDFKTKKIHSYRAIWSQDEISPKQLNAFGWQAIQANSIMPKNQLSKDVEHAFHDMEADVLRAIRFWRDKEKEAGIVSGKGHRMFDLLRRTFYQRRSKQK